MGNKTTILISHDLNVVRGADEIVVLEDGRVVERGTHAVLAAGGGTYARMCAEMASQETDEKPEAIHA
jgi:ABC-type multidrug transport system fused ATPase/permease subunit